MPWISPKSLLLAVPACALLALAAASRLQAVRAKNAVADFESSTGLNVILDDCEPKALSRWFDEVAHRNEIMQDRANTHETSPSEVAAVLPLLTTAVRRYPVGFVKSRVSNVVLCSGFGSMEADGSWRLVGTYSTSKKSIILAADEDPAVTSTTFHHEFSSVLLVELIPKDTEAINRWIHSSKTLPASLGGDINRWKHLSATEQHFAYEAGRVTAYGFDGAENDFNTYSEIAFGNPERARELIQTYPIIRDRYLAFKDLYIRNFPELAYLFDFIPAAK